MVGQLGMPHILQKIIALSLLIIMLPLILIISLISLILWKGKVFFTQSRVGYQEQVFKLWKFRSLPSQTNTQASPQPGLWGKVLRKSSLDELPQLWNILKGDMNLVGPRPLLPEYLELYSSSQRKRHEVLPGITGWAQINGGNRLGWQEKFDLDLEYIQRRSIRLDIEILGKTLPLLLLRRDANVFNEPFKGNF